VTSRPTISWMILAAVAFSHQRACATGAASMIGPPHQRLFRRWLKRRPDPFSQSVHHVEERSTSLERAVSSSIRIRLALRTALASPPSAALQSMTI
jgi:hypothetical protein